MQKLNQVVPWLLTVLSVISIGVGLDGSPTKVPAAGFVDIDGVPIENPIIPFSCQEEMCSGQNESEEVFRLVGFVSPGNRKPTHIAETLRMHTYNN